MNQTTVSLGAMVGAAMSILWWILSEMTDITAPDAIVAASVSLATSVLQMIVPYRQIKKTRKDDTVIL